MTYVGILAPVAILWLFFLIYAFLTKIILDVRKISEIYNYGRVVHDIWKKHINTILAQRAQNTKKK